MVYRGKARPADRFQGTPCGCVIRYPDIEMFAQAAGCVEVQGEYAMLCFGRNPQDFPFDLYKWPADRVSLVDATTAAVYYWAVRDDELGVRWQ